MSEDRKRELVNLQVELNDLEDNYYTHNFNVKTEVGLGGLTVANLLILNSLVDKELGEPYVCSFEYKSGYSDVIGIIKEGTND